MIQRSKPTDEPEPYVEPDPENGVWPDDWTPRQRENWIDFGQPVYDALETDVGRYWYRRVYRPKARHEGMMTRDHVKLGNPEDYVAEMVSDNLNPMGDVTGAMMRVISSYSVDKDELDEAVSDITGAKIKNMSDEQKKRLVGDAQRMARAYGLDA